MVINTDERNRNKILDDLVKGSEKRDMEVRRVKIKSGMKRKHYQIS